MGYEEKMERIELIDAVSDAGRLARGLDQLLESLAHADQLDPLDVEGTLALRSISEKSLFSTPPVERERSALGGKAVALPAPASSIPAGARNWGALDQLSPLMVSSSSAM